MSKEKQTIEEMARDVCDSIVWDQDGYAEVDCLSTAKVLRLKGYCKQEWISVDERLPDVLQEVLVYRGNHIGNLINAYTYVGGDMWKDEYGFGCRREDEGITHWMPLPEAPKMKGGTE